MLNRTHAPAFHPIEGIPFLHPQEFELKNGVKVFLFDSGEQEIVRIQWVFENTDFDIEKPLINSALAGMLLEGTSKFSSAQIAEKADFFGAFLHPEYSFDHTSLTLFSLNKHVEKLIPLVFDVLTDSIFPEKELKTYIRNNKQRLRISLEKNDYVARKKFNHVLFGDSRYGYDRQESDFDKVKRKDLQKAFSEKFVPKNCTLFISGKIDPALLKNLSVTFGEKWENGKEKQAFEIHIPESMPSDLVLVEKPNSLQSAIRLGNRSIPRSHPDFPGLQVLNTILGGYFGSRLMMNIREEKGYTYGIGSGIASMEYASFFTIASEVGTEVCTATLTEIEKEINRLNTELVGEEELTLVKNYILGSLMGSLENVFSHTDKFKQVYFSGLTLDYYLYYTEVVNAISSKELKSLANRYLDFDRMVKVVVGQKF
jgi:predicted Zn-dependent peptidase